MTEGWTPAYKSNTFKKGDLVIFRSTGPTVVMTVDHVETSRVFVTKTSSSKRLFDLPASELMLLSEWANIYRRKD